jgi:hypothetical protein
LGHLALQQVGLLFDELGQLGTVDLVAGFVAGFASLVIGRLPQPHVQRRGR